MLRMSDSKIICVSYKKKYKLWMHLLIQIQIILLKISQK